MALLAAVFQVTHCSVLGLNSREERMWIMWITNVEYRAVACVFQNIDTPPPSPPSEYVLPPHQRRVGTHTLAGRWGGGGVNSLEDARHWIGSIIYKLSTVWIVQETGEQSMAMFTIFLGWTKFLKGGGGGRKINCLEKAQGLICNMLGKISCVC
jgi:hypothetical protein